MAQYLSALLRQESQFNPQAVSPVGAQGIAQFMPKTAEAWQVDPFNPQSAIPGAAAYLAKYYRYFDGDWTKTLASYNAGPGRAMDGSWAQIDETQLYIKNINKYVREMQESEGVPRTVQGQFPGANLRADQQAIEEERYNQNLNALFDGLVRYKEV